MNAHLQADLKAISMEAELPSFATSRSEFARLGSGRRAPAIFALMLVMVALVGWIDYMTSLELSVSLLYLVPITLATRWSGRRMGYTIALVSAAVWLAADWMERQTYGHWYLPVWNTLTLTISFLIVVALLASLRDANEGLERKVTQRTKALQDEVAQRRRAEDEARHALREVRDAHSELQCTQFQLIEAAKMESVARLAAGVAHEVKNPLTTLGLGADYYLNRRTDSADEIQLAKDMKEAVQRASNVINILLDYSRSRPLQLTSEDLHTVIENSLTLMRHPLNRQHITVVREFAPELPPVELDRTRIEHVFVNLFTNAMQAMPPGGTLTVRTFASNGANGGSHQVITVEVDDTGHGIRPENASKLFEPFFSTKPPGQGTGLGLTVARRIMEIQSGSLRLENRKEGGARAILHFNPERKARL
jgi:signal transduction histidine kinase